MRKVKSLVLGALTVATMLFAKAPTVNASEYSVKVTINKQHAGSEKIDYEQGADVHFLWDDSFYEDKSGKRTKNVLKNAPAYLKWNIVENEKTQESEFNSMLKQNEATAIQKKIGASADFVTDVTNKSNASIYALTAPGFPQWEQDNCIFDFDFTFDPQSVTMGYRYAKNMMKFGTDVQLDEAWYYPQMKGKYAITIKNSSSERIGYMEIPVTVSLDYPFKTKDNLSAANKKGKNTVWAEKGFVMNDNPVKGGFTYFDFDACWILATYYKQDNIIGEITLEPGEKYPLSLANQTTPIHMNYTPEKVYYLADQNGVRAVTKEQLPFNIGYDDSLISVDSKGILTAKKEGVARVEVFYPETKTDELTSLVYRITIKSKTKNVTVKKAKAAGSKKVKVTWKKCKGIAGYQLQYSTNKKFKKAKTIMIGRKKTFYTLKNLNKKKYYVRMRSYISKSVYDKMTKNGNGWTSKDKLFYSKWSKAKKVTVK